MPCWKGGPLLSKISSTIAILWKNSFSQHQATKWIYYHFYPKRVQPEYISSAKNERPLGFQVWLNATGAPKRKFKSILLVCCTAVCAPKTAVTAVPVQWHGMLDWSQKLCRGHGGEGSLELSLVSLQGLDAIAGLGELLCEAAHLGFQRTRGRRL